MDKPKRIETLRAGRLELTIWEHLRDQRLVVVLKFGEKILDSQSFETLSGARSWGYFEILKILKVKRN